MAYQQPSSDLADYSPAATLVPFHRPIPLLRQPVKASPLDNPESGPYLLAFKDPRSWASAYTTCESVITNQCEAGSRIGCSIAASSKCQPPWWKSLLGLAKPDFAERAKCEEREMEACVAAASVRCREFAKEKCLKAFREARIASKELNLMVNGKEVVKLVSWVCLKGEMGEMVEILKPRKSWGEFRIIFEASNFKGSDLLGPDNTDNTDIYLRSCSVRK